MTTDATCQGCGATMPPDYYWDPTFGNWCPECDRKRNGQSEIHKLAEAAIESVAGHGEGTTYRTEFTPDAKAPVVNIRELAQQAREYDPSKFTRELRESLERLEAKNWESAGGIYFVRELVLLLAREELDKRQHSRMDEEQALSPHRASGGLTMPCDCGPETRKLWEQVRDFQAHHDDVAEENQRLHQKVREQQARIESLERALANKIVTENPLENPK